MVQAYLLELMREFDLSPWSWVKDVRIDRHLQALGQCFLEDGVPVIRLRSMRPLSPEEEALQARDTKDRLLGIYIHEQLHQYLDLQSEETLAAVEVLRNLYPEVPVGGTEGAMNEFSTYLHLILCTLELDAMALLIGEARYRDLKAAPRFYRFIWRTVLEDTEPLRDLIRRVGLTSPAAAPTARG
ncbi:hypothetical protein QOL99_09910 [Deinococcus sp. MIMF12]|uniref:Uncharacterized protein n=1 Tax=Deinococcus rhizophilus TaxID=3049544 RepID=A0ABT7JKI7_9DEIO|nr:hypothetical protein [Deinococcus rhizophilus]MDL2344468.1 hypothetical protein [Deinococcus rhizophilus]